MTDFCDDKINTPARIYTYIDRSTHEQISITSAQIVKEISVYLSKFVKFTRCFMTKMKTKNNWK